MFTLLTENLRFSHAVVSWSKPWFVKVTGFSFTEQGGDYLYSYLPLPSAHEHSDIYLQLCM